MFLVQTMTSKSPYEINWHLVCSFINNLPPCNERAETSVARFICRTWPIWQCRLWQYGLWSFQTGYIKLKRFLHRKFLNFENWTNGELQLLAKIRVFKVDYFIRPLFLVPKLRSVHCSGTKWAEKTPIYIFFLLSVQK